LWIKKKACHPERSEGPAFFPDRNPIQKDTSHESFKGRSTGLQAGEIKLQMKRLQPRAVPRSRPTPEGE
jgi:hypothetical protein